MEEIDEDNAIEPQIPRPKQMIDGGEPNTADF